MRMIKARNKGKRRGEMKIINMNEIEMQRCSEGEVLDWRKWGIIFFIQNRMRIEKISITRDFSLRLFKGLDRECQNMK